MKLRTEYTPIPSLHPDLVSALSQLNLDVSTLDVGSYLNPLLAQASQSYSGKQARQAAHLAEAIYLAYFQANGQMEAGLIRLLNHFVDTHFPNNVQKRAVLDQIIEEIVATKQNEARFNTLTTLRNQTHSFPPQTYPSSPQLADLIAQAHPAEATTYGDLVMLPPKAPYVVIGDSHGDATSTQQILNTILTQNRKTIPFIIFMGDYVHNGLKSIDNLIIILTLKARYPKRVILLSGNHDYQETYKTALNEYFNKHWQAAIKNTHLDKTPPHHYGHLRLDFVREFGVERGETLSRSFAEWGQQLPYICLAPDGTMMSHSIGKAQHLTTLMWADLVTAKTDDVTAMQQLGMSEWGYQRTSQHSAMVNNRIITNDLLADFEALGIKRFIVGHTHYRSGDWLLNDRLITVCSSHLDSPDAGHYMYQEMVLNRHQNRGAEALSLGNAFPCYALVIPGKLGQTKIKIHLVSLEEPVSAT